MSSLEGPVTTVAALRGSSLSLLAPQGAGALDVIARREYLRPGGAVVDYE